MAGKARVHELAKELGVTSKELLARLKEQGEFVKSASSTVEAPVARRLRESFRRRTRSPRVANRRVRRRARCYRSFRPQAGCPASRPQAGTGRPRGARSCGSRRTERTGRPGRPRTASGTGTHAGSQARPAGSCGAGSGRSGCVSGPGRPQARRSAPRPQAAARR
ncbi:hypothetical protein GS438_03830 [Rhodococcus hoagii]|nr:hypothetical protein [Prescottella equi]